MSMPPVLLILSFLLFFLLRYITQKKRPLPATKHLTPGSMGWPYIGETFQLYSNNPNNFFAEKERKYGAVFKTHMLGCPCVMVSSPEAARFVLVTKANLFLNLLSRPVRRGCSVARPSSSREVITTPDFVASFFELLCRKPSAGIEEIAVRVLSSCDGGFINTFQEMKTVSFGYLKYEIKISRT